jgi:hypothetical protein
VQWALQPGSRGCGPSSCGCTVTHAGRYELSISGIREGVDASKLGIVFTTPYRARMSLFIVGLVFSGMLTIASIVFGALALTGVI